MAHRRPAPGSLTLLSPQGQGKAGEDGGGLHQGQDGGHDPSAARGGLRIQPLGERAAEDQHHGEAEAHRRAFQGTTKPVFFQGGECGEIREYSDGLAQFLLKAHRPEKYRERSQVDNNITGATSVTVLTGVPSDSDVSDIL